MLKETFICDTEKREEASVFQVMLPKLYSREQDRYPFTLLLPVITFQDLKKINYIWTLNASKLVDSQYVDIKDIYHPINCPIKIDLILFETPYNFKAKCFLKLCSCEDVDFLENKVISTKMYAGKTAATIYITPDDLEKHQMCYGGSYCLKVIIIVDSIKYDSPLIDSTQTNILINPNNERILNLKFVSIKGQKNSQGFVRYLTIINFEEWSLKSPFFYVLFSKLIQKNPRKKLLKYEITAKAIEFFGLFHDAETMDKNLIVDFFPQILYLANLLQISKFKEIYENEILNIAKESNKYTNFELMVIGNKCCSSRIISFALNAYEKEYAALEKPNNWTENINNIFKFKKELAKCIRNTVVPELPQLTDDQQFYMMIWDDNLLTKT